MIAPFIVALIAAPTAMPSSPPVIEQVRASLTCTIARHTLDHALDDLRQNDSLMNKATSTITRMGTEARSAWTNPGGTGGQGAGLELHEVQIESLLQSMKKNADESQSLLGNDAAFPSEQQHEAQQALQARDELNHIRERQAEAINALYGLVQSDESRDLQSRTNPVPDYHQTGPAVNALDLVDPAAFHAYLHSVSQAESHAEATIHEIAARCGG